MQDEEGNHKGKKEERKGLHLQGEKGTQMVRKGKEWFVTEV